MTHIHGYTMGHVGAATAAAAVSGEGLSQLRASVLFGDDDRAALRRAGELLDDQIDALLDVWYGFVGSQPHLLSAFMNLAVNAVRYTPPGGVITLRYGRTDEAVCYEVEDTGFGIPAEHIDRITERFYRVSVSRSREKGGTGLGLAIVKHVLQLHGGRLVIESEVGKGSRFRCILPAERLSVAA